MSADGDAHGEGGAAARHGLEELIAERRAKREALERRPGRLPARVRRRRAGRGVLSAYEQLQPGEETDERHRVAGRIAARRGSGKAAFLDLVDRTGKIQLHARQDILGEERYALLTSLDLGDLLGVDGSAMRSRHGEVSLRVEDFQVLGKALRPPPDKHHGLTDVETRYRHRELDLISSAESSAACSWTARGSSRRCAPRSTPTASSRSRRRFCSRSTAGRWRGRSRHTTTRWTATSTCGSPPSSTSSG